MSGEVGCGGSEMCSQGGSVESLYFWGYRCLVGKVSYSVEIAEITKAYS